MKKLLITGAGGYIGGELVRRLANDDEFSIIAADIRDTPSDKRLQNVKYAVTDIRDESFLSLMDMERPDVIVHLASIVSAGGNPEFDYSVDVLGTKNVLEACVKYQVKQLIVTSSGAAYGYHADSPKWLSENDPLRGNEDFAYSRHKRMVEEILADYREKHPQVKQLIFRPGSVIGPTVSNQITNLFKKPFVLGVAGSDCSFVFISDTDVINCILKGIREAKEGIYNLAGDGALPMREIAEIIGKPYIPLPAWLIGGALGLVRLLGLGKLGPEHVKFLQFRPVLSNEKLKKEFGIDLGSTSRQAFDAFWLSQGSNKR